MHVGKPVPAVRVPSEGLEVVQDGEDNMDSDKDDGADFEDSLPAQEGHKQTFEQSE